MRTKWTAVLFLAALAAAIAAGVAAVRTVSSSGPKTVPTAHDVPIIRKRIETQFCNITQRCGLSVTAAIQSQNIKAVQRPNQLEHPFSIAAETVLEDKCNRVCPTG